MPDFTTNWLSMAFLAGPLALQSERSYRELPQLARLPQLKSLPSLSIIVPARNETDNLQRLLPSLTAISYPGSWEILVVDDNSTDDTAAIAGKLGANVLCLHDLPEGWSGKTYACHQGALAASGEWLLFTDADTIHYLDGPARSVAHATIQNLDGLSIFIGHTTSGFIDGLALSVAFAGLFVGLEPNTPTLNGQYILLRRDIYASSGGFSSVRGESMEDLALGHHLRKNGYRVPLFRSDEVAMVQMYTDNSTLWHGLTRLGPGSLRWMGGRAIITALFITGVMAPILSLATAIGLRRNRKWALGSWVVVALSFIPWARRFGSARLALLAPLGALMVQVAALWGLAHRLLGRGTNWKGRSI